MLSFQPLRLEDQKDFVTLQRSDSENNESSFATLFLWRHRWKIEIARSEGILYLASRLPGDGRPIHYPPVVPEGGSVIRALAAAEEDLAAKGASMLVKYAPEAFVERLRREGGGPWSIRETRDEFDYVYSARELAGLGGRKYHGQRNHLNFFLREYSYRYEELTSGHLRDCMTVYDRWLEQQGGRIGEEGERLAAQEALTHLETLGLMGAIVYVGDAPAAFTVAETFRPEMALIHLEKADPAYRGAFQLINQQFVYRGLRGFSEINRQEDMGMEGIRQAKMAYHPVRLVKKYDIFR